MKKYYILLNDRQEGPYTLDEVVLQSLTIETPIWYNGLPEWTTVKYLPEVLADLRSTPPPVPKKPFTTIWRFLRFAAFLFLLAWISMGAYSYFNERKNSNISNASYTEKVLTIEEIEKADPIRFLNANAQYRETLFGSKYVLYLKVANSATVAEYKDVVVRVEYISRTNSVISSEDHSLYDYFPANHVRSFEFKINKPNASSGIRCYVVRASSRY